MKATIVQTKAHTNQLSKRNAQREADKTRLKDQADKCHNDLQDDLKFLLEKADRLILNLPKVFSNNSTKLLEISILKLNEYKLLLEESSTDIKLIINSMLEEDIKYIDSVYEQPENSEPAQKSYKETLIHRGSRFHEQTSKTLSDIEVKHQKLLQELYRLYFAASIRDIIINSQKDKESFDVLKTQLEEFVKKVHNSRPQVLKLVFGEDQSQEEITIELILKDLGFEDKPGFISMIKDAIYSLIREFRNISQRDAQRDAQREADKTLLKDQLNIDSKEIQDELKKTLENVKVLITDLPEKFCSSNNTTKILEKAEQKVKEYQSSLKNMMSTETLKTLKARYDSFAETIDSKYKQYENGQFPREEFERTLQHMIKILHHAASVEVSNIRTEYESLLKESDELKKEPPMEFDEKLKLLGEFSTNLLYIITTCQRDRKSFEFLKTQLAECIEKVHKSTPEVLELVFDGEESQQPKAIEVVLKDIGFEDRSGIINRIKDAIYDLIRIFCKDETINKKRINNIERNFKGHFKQIREILDPFINNNLSRQHASLYRPGETPRETSLSQGAERG